MPDLPPKTRRAALEIVSRNHLAAITDGLKLTVEDRRSHAAHVDAIVRARSVDFADVLRLLSREELKAICDTLGLETSGKEKDAIIERIMAFGERVEQMEEKPKQAGGANGKKNGGDLGFEDKLWRAADELRGNMDAAEYKHVVLVGIHFRRSPPACAA